MIQALGYGDLIVCDTELGLNRTLNTPEDS